MYSYQRQHEDASLMSVELMIDQQNECREEAEYLAGKDYLGKGNALHCKSVENVGDLQFPV